MLPELAVETVFIPVLRIVDYIVYDIITVAVTPYQMVVDATYFATIRTWRAMSLLAEDFVECVGGLRFDVLAAVRLLV